MDSASKQISKGPALFKEESERAENSATIGNKKKISNADYTELLGHYHGLLNKAIKITNIGNISQMRLIKTQKSLESANLRLRKFAERKSEILDFVAHDLKDRISTVSMLVDMVLEETTDEADKIHEALTGVETAAEEIHSLVNGVLELETAESGREKINKDHHDLIELVDAVLSYNSLYASRKNIKLHFNAGDSAIAIVDEMQVRYIFDSLINNAIKFSPPGNEVWISIQKRGTGKRETRPGVPNNFGGPGTPEGERSSRAHDEFFRFSVRDEGPGLTEKDKQNLFQHFKRLSATPTDDEASAGLGLAIVSQYVEMHGGRVWAESEGPSKGTTFFVDLPAS
jgi:signal transduction histidine kinase